VEVVVVVTTVVVVVVVVDVVVVGAWVVVVVEGRVVVVVDVVVVVTGPWVVVVVVGGGPCTDTVHPLAPVIGIGLPPVSNRDRTVRPIGVTAAVELTTLNVTFATLTTPVGEVRL
jgi:hypothetical protein